jgi:hypothetical protein
MNQLLVDNHRLDHRTLQRWKQRRLEVHHQEHVYREAV